MPLQQPKVALVHDDFIQEGGAESLFAEIAQIYPDAPIYTSLVNWQKLDSSISKNRIRTSFIQKIPFAAKVYKALLPLYPLAFESFDLSRFDLVISSTTRFSKGIITRPKTIHVCYINSPPRFLWDHSKRSDYLPPILNFSLWPILGWLKRWDRASAARVDYYIANSKNVAEGVKKIYGRQTGILHPFADTNFFVPAKIHNWKLKNQKYYLIVSRLVRWKKIDIAVKAAQSLGANLKIVGTGSDISRLKKLSTINPLRPSPVFSGRSEASNQQSTIEFLGRISKEKLRELYQNAQALIVTQEEDFGIAMVEAQACGIPVIAYGRGGAKEIIKDKITGLFFKSQAAKSLEDAIGVSLELKWSEQAARRNALRFSKANFIRNLKKVINEKS